MTEPKLVEVPGFGMMYCRPGFPDAASAAWNMAHAARHRPIGRPKTIVDLGCFVGTTMVDLARRFPRATVYGAELDRANYEVACKNTKRFTRCHVTHVGISSMAGNGEYGELSENEYTLTTGGQRQAPCITLDQFLERLGLEEVDFIKMDIEGTEEAVLAEGGAWTSCTKELAVEVHNYYTADHASDVLRQWGFRTEIEGTELVRAFKV